MRCHNTLAVYRRLPWPPSPRASPASSTASPTCSPTFSGRDFFSQPDRTTVVLTVSTTAMNRLIVLCHNVLIVCSLLSVPPAQFPFLFVRPTIRDPANSRWGIPCVRPSCGDCADTEQSEDEQHDENGYKDERTALWRCLQRRMLCRRTRISPQYRPRPGKPMPIPKDPWLTPQAWLPMLAQYPLFVLSCTALFGVLRARRCRLSSPSLRFAIS